MEWGQEGFTPLLGGRHLPAAPSLRKQPPAPQLLCAQGINYPPPPSFFWLWSSKLMELTSTTVINCSNA